MRKENVICAGCGNSHLWGKQTQCSDCDEKESREHRLDVITLNAVETLDDLKEWIKEHMIK